MSISTRRPCALLAIASAFAATGCGAGPSERAREERAAPVQRPGQVLDAAGRIVMTGRDPFAAGGTGELLGPFRAYHRTTLMRGRDLRLALSPPAQRVARAALDGRRGGVVAIDVESGAVRVLAGAGRHDPVRSLVEPGSTMKAAMAGAALDAGAITSRTLLDGDRPSFPGVANVGGERAGPITVSEALALSSNTAFSDLMKRLGAPALERALRRAGWGTPPPIDLPWSSLRASVARVPSLTDPDGRYRDPDELQRSTVTQLARLAAAIAGDGTAPTMRLARTEAAPERTRMLGAGTAVLLRRALRAAVTRGTATSMDDPSFAVGAKTGTTSLGETGNQATVIAWAPAARPRVAIAVSLVAETTQTGGDTAGPVALEVLRELDR